MVNKPSQTDWKAFERDLSEWVKERNAKRAEQIKSKQRSPGKSIATFIAKKSGGSSKPKP